jgi:chitin disaccharide deacetylase
LTTAPGDEVRRLIVNADDLGRSAPINRGVIQAHENGILTSASLMVRWPAAPEAAAYARRRPSLSVGLHLDFGEWAFRDGEWTRTYEVVDGEDEEAMEAEAHAQLESFRELVGRDPTHLDSHQHVHRGGAAAAAAGRLAGELAVPLREQDPRIRYCGDFYGQAAEGQPMPEAITSEALIAILAALPPGTTELGCHPGDGSEPSDPYDRERRRELSALCDQRVRRTLERERIELVTFRPS